MCEPLINKGYINNTDIYRVRWITKEGKTYTGNISFDVDYNAYGEKDIPLTGINIDDKGNEVKIDTFHSKDIKSAVEGLINYHEYLIEGYINDIKEFTELPFGNTKIRVYIELIKQEYEHIMAIELWLEDAI